MECLRKAGCCLADFTTRWLLLCASVQPKQEAGKLFEQWRQAFAWDARKFACAATGHSRNNPIYDRATIRSVRPAEASLTGRSGAPELAPEKARESGLIPEQLAA